MQIFKTDINAKRSIGWVGLMSLKNSLFLAVRVGLLIWFLGAICGYAAFLPCGRHRRLQFGQFPEVLGGGCEGKFVLDATWPSQSEPA